MQHIDSGSTLRNFKLTISYDGRQFHGWQIQNNAMTVQEAFQTALSKIIGDDFDLKGCSRTDSGVHANMYCISLKTSHPIADVRLKAALNRWLPLSIAVLDCEEADIDFHRYLVECMDNNFLGLLAEGFAGWLITPLYASLQVRKQSERSYRAHVGVYEALKKRDPDLAEKAMRAHLDEMRGIYQVDVMVEEKVEQGEEQQS